MYTPDAHLPQVQKHSLGTVRGHTQTSADTRPHRHTVCRAHLGTLLRAPAHACLHTSVWLTGLTARQAPPPPIHLSADCGQQAGLKPGRGGWASRGIGMSRHQAGERRRLDDLGRLGKEGPALPQDEELINRMN